MSYNDRYDDYLKLNETDQKIQMLKTMIEGRLHDSPLSVGNEHIKDGAIDYFKLGHGSIDSVHIRDASINSAHIQNAVIGTVHIGDATITNAKIDRATVNRIKIETADILDAAITSAKIKDAEITNAHLQAAIIDSAKIANAAIQSAHIDVGVVGTTQIADGSITDAKIVDLTANKIVAGTLDAGKVNVVNLKADNIVTGSLTIVPNNEFKDSKFDVLPTGISHNVNMTYALDSTTKFKGTNSLKTTAGGSDAYLYFGQEFNVMPGEKFIFSTYAKGDAARSGQLYIQFKDAAGTVLSHSGYTFTTTTSWDRYYQVFTAPTNATHFKLRIDNDGGSNSIIWFDAIQIQRGNIITEYAERHDEVISDSAIKEPMLSNGSVSTRLIQADAVTSDKIVADAITARHVAANSLTANEIDVSTITIGTANIADAAVTNAKIGSIDAGKITTGTLDADKVSINANLSNVGSYIKLTGTGIVAHNGTKETFKIDDYGNATFSGKLVGGSIESNSTINITTDATVGKTLYIGSSGDTTQKKIYFSSGAQINGNTGSLSAGISMSASEFYFSGHSWMGLGVNLEQYNYSDETYFVNKGKETGLAGIGARDDVGSTSFLGGVAVQWPTRRPGTPTSITFSTRESNKGASYTDMHNYGMWLYMSGNGTIGYYYWRGNYTISG